MNPCQVNLVSVWLVIQLCLLSLSANGQHTPFKGANVILITTDLADKESYIAIAQVLSEQSISYTAGNNVLLIQSIDQSFNGKKDLVFDGQLSVSAGLVTLTGVVRNKSENPHNQEIANTVPIAYTKAKSSLQQVGFTYMNDLAQKLQRVLHGVITYKLQTMTKYQ